jgi:hypothetical protein
LLARPATERARKTATAPNQPTDDTTCAVSMNRRIPGVIVIGASARHL